MEPKEEDLQKMTDRDDKWIWFEGGLLLGLIIALIIILLTKLTG